jgi:hypothetical protein
MGEKMQTDFMKKTGFNQNALAAYAQQIQAFMQ